MKTTLNIPDELFQRAKNAAHERRTTLKSIVIQALERFLGPEPNVATPLRTHVWPPVGVSNSSIESENILQMIRQERDGGARQSLDDERANSHTPTGQPQSSKPVRKVRK